jgi:hypothetical protein
VAAVVTKATPTLVNSDCWICYVASECGEVTILIRAGKPAVADNIGY